MRFIPRFLFLCVGIIANPCVLRRQTGKTAVVTPACPPSVGHGGRICRAKRRFTSIKKELLLLCKAKRQYLLTCKVSRYCLLALHGRAVTAYFNVSSHCCLFLYARIAMRAVASELFKYILFKFIVCDHRSYSAETSTNQSINQSVNQLIDQSIDWCIVHLLIHF